jgi:hypothetical protein
MPAVTLHSPLAKCRIGRSGGLRPPAISFFLVLVVGFADHEHQKKTLYGACGPALPAGEFASSIFAQLLFAVQRMRQGWRFDPLIVKEMEQACLE